MEYAMIIDVLPLLISARGAREYSPTSQALAFVVRLVVRRTPRLAQNDLAHSRGFFRLWIFRQISRATSAIPRSML
eukprot:1700159-Pyramimonas_sp.AAC.1